MSLSTIDSAHLFVSLGILLCMAIGGGRLFASLRQPPVIGEIVAGLVLGPTVLGWIANGTERWLFPTTGAVAHAMGAFYQLGMLFLIFVTGAELRTSPLPGERRTVGAIALVGLTLPLAVGLGAAWILNPARFSGPDGTHATFVLTFGMSIAVTSIPVISRIMLDIGILHTPFARVVLAVAVAEDVVLYVVLGIVLSLARHQSSQSFGLWALTHDHSPTYGGLYYTAATLAFFAVFMTLGRQTYALAVSSRTARRPGPGTQPVAAGIALLLAGVLMCSLLGIDQIFGALAAGICVGRTSHIAEQDRPEPAAGRAESALREVSMSFFIPVYFAVVGVNLDLRHYFDVLFFVWFLPAACVVKSAAVWLGARLGGRDGRDAVDFAVAMNARGGPGILLATVTFGAGVINERFFTSLVLLSIITSQIAGLWLDRRRGATMTTTEPALAAIAEVR